MSELTTAQLAALSPILFTAQLKQHLRNDEDWLLMLSPEIVERTRAGMHRMISSMDAQLARVAASNKPDPKWEQSVRSLRKHVVRRLESMPPSTLPPVASSREARAWRGFAATLAELLEEGGPEGVLDAVRPPYLGMTTQEWLDARRAKAVAS